MREGLSISESVGVASPHFHSTRGGRELTVIFLSNFRKLNQIICRKPFSIPKIQYMLLNLEGFTYAYSLDFNMGYYHIEFSTGLKRIFTIILPCVKYEYQKLPMGVCNSPDVLGGKYPNY